MDSKISFLEDILRLLFRVQHLTSLFKTNIIEQVFFYIVPGMKFIDLVVIFHKIRGKENVLALGEFLQKVTISSCGTH